MRCYLSRPGEVPREIAPRAGNAMETIGSAPCRSACGRLLLILAVLLAAVRVSTAADSEPEVVRLQGAIEQYTAAMECPDRDRRLNQFAQAEQLFRQIIEGDTEHAPIQNPGLYVNMGNAALQAERLGPAIVAYRHALSLDPSHAQALQNLAYTRSLLPDWVRYEASHGWIDSLFFWRSMLTDNQVKMGGAMCFLLAAGLVAAGIYSSQNLWRNLAFIPALAWVILTASLILNSEGDAMRNAVVVQDARVHTADSANSPLRFSKPLPSGAELSLLEQRQRWAELELPDGRTGWVLASAIEIVDGN